MDMDGDLLLDPDGHGDLLHDVHGDRPVHLDRVRLVHVHGVGAVDWNLNGHLHGVWNLLLDRYGDRLGHADFDVLVDGDSTDDGLALGEDGSSGHSRPSGYGGASGASRAEEAAGSGGEGGCSQVDSRDSGAGPEARACREARRRSSIAGAGDDGAG